jgi:serine/threonine protein kinase
VHIEPQTRLGRFEIRSLIGEGGMGQVYRATDSALGRDVAIKVLPRDLANAPDRLARFELEARAAGALNHPNILAIYDVGTYDGAPYVVSELLEGDTLAQRLERGALTSQKTVDYACQIARGLAAAHAKGIIHRDLKPQNLFITRDGHVKILDFGLAKLTSSQSEAMAESETATHAVHNTMPGVVIGTAGYMSPEQVRGEPADHRADIFSFGAVFYEMLTGTRAFHGASLFETMSAILTKEPPPLSEANRSLTPVFERIVQHCLEKRADDRFQSARDLLFDLEALDTFSGSTANRVAPKTSVGRRLRAAMMIAVVAAIAAATFAIGRFSIHQSSPSYTQLTFRRGTIWSARFSEDGGTLVYSAAWNGGASDLFMARPDSQESRPLGLQNADVLSVSNSGEMAILVKRHSLGAQFTQRGMLARMPLAGGSPREVLEDVQAADWSPDGRDLAIVRYVAGRNRLEFPIGKTLYETSGWISHPRVSPSGDAIAFLDHQVQWDNRGWVAMVDLAGRKTTLSGEWSGEEGLVWSPSGDEIWFTAARGGEPFSLHAVTRGGRERVISRSPTDLMIHDISRNGDALLTVAQFSSDIIALAPGDTRERNLSWLDNVRVRDMSADGSSFVFSHFGAGSGPNYTVYMRDTSGAPPVRLGEGAAWALSPDRKWVLAILSTPPEMVLLPTGAGEVRHLPRNGIEVYGIGASWHPDGKQVLFNGRQRGRAMRTYAQAVDGGAQRPITPEGSTGTVISPDGARIVTTDAKGRRLIYPLDGSEPREIPGLEGNLEVVRWAADGRSLYVASQQELPVRIYRLELATGRRELVKELQPTDPAGVVGSIPVLLSDDARSYIYGLTRTLTSLFVVKGL